MQLWAEALGLLAGALAAVAAAWWLLSGSGAGARNGRAVVTVGVLAFVLAGIAWSWAAAAWTLSTAPGRYVLVVDEREVSWRSRFRKLTANWIELVELDGRRIGWVQVGSARWSHLQGEHVVAIWGQPGQVRWLVLSGAFPVTRVLGSVRSAEPAPP